MAFGDLSQTRPAGFGISAIPTVEIEAWLNIHGINEPDARIEYYRYIRALDSYLLKYEASKKDNNNGRPSKTRDKN